MQEGLAEERIRVHGSRLIVFGGSRAVKKTAASVL
jgi:hypothetical protein